MASHSQLPRRGTPVSSQSQTITSTASQSQPGTQAILRLRGAHDPSQRRIQWAEDVVDNEGLGRKKSKVCCIYHRPKAVDESSDESSSSDSSSDESDFEGTGGRRKVPSGDGKGKGRGRKCDGHDHEDGHHHSHDHDRNRQGDREGSDKEKRRPSPNAYERIPKPPKPKEGSQPDNPASA